MTPDPGATHDPGSATPPTECIGRFTMNSIREIPLRVSVIVPTYNGEETIAGLLETLAATEDCGWELIVVDDGSTDATASVIRELSTKPKQTRLITLTANRGKAAALNLGVAQARFDKLVFLDDDDRPAPGYLRALSNALEGNEFVCSAVRFGELNRPSLVKALFRPDVGYFTVPLRAARSSGSGFVSVPVSLGGTLAVRRRTLSRVGGFNARAGVCDDVDLCLRLWLLGVVLKTEPEAILDYRLRTGSHGLFSQRLQYGRGWSWMYEAYRLDGMVRPTRLATIARIARALIRLLFLSPGSVYKAAIAEAGFAAGLAMGHPSNSERISHCD
jgi:glycosyltransferase involved in cell wall biosynthesis